MLILKARAQLKMYVHKFNQFLKTPLAEGLRLFSDKTIGSTKVLAYISKVVSIGNKSKKNKDTTSISLQWLP